MTNYNPTPPSVVKILPWQRAQPPTTPQPFCDTLLLPPTPTAVQWRAESETHRRRDKQLAREFYGRTSGADADADADADAVGSCDGGFGWE
ncbi:hypothetical protein PLEOSDRAFT_152136 [Pleurotus ostreatus PC15]|uniref:Uncharacterized protein n=1 Tax=Pleurotus ostreatus (strain PC15) TaxID=1137138 RepID=A0A067P253_PLEO1|nr:hypothetical protein PLEOSDRAFT_152136 [Pleurotus ostreatus PC15]